MQAAQDRQSQMLEGLLKQRDMYKTMYQQCITQSCNTSDLETNDQNKGEENTQAKKTVTNLPKESNQVNDELNMIYKQLQDSEIRFNQLKSDFDVYRKEKMTHEQMLNDENERLRKDSEKNSVRCCRLKAQLDSANERFSLLQGNVTTYKYQIKVLEEKCNNYSTTIGKYICYFNI
jgi:chromosome segregation ATPase